MFDSLYRLLGQVISFFFNLVPNYGVAIILLTIFVRLVLLPLTIKQTKSMQAMQKLQPQMKELQAKYKGDKQRLNEEMMKLYKTHQVNPLGGCLPLVLQFPVFIALFRVLNSCGVKVAKGKACPAAAIGTKYLPVGSAILATIQKGNTSFLGMKMGTSPAEIISTAGLVAAIPYLVLLALMGITTWYQTKQAQGAQPPGANNQMAIVGKIMPIMLIVFSYRFPVGVSIYWVVSNLWTIGQQHVLLRPAALAAAGAGGAAAALKGGGPAPKGGAGGRGGSAGPKGGGSGPKGGGSSPKGGGSSGQKAGGSSGQKSGSSGPKGGGSGQKSGGSSQKGGGGGVPARGGRSQKGSGAQRATSSSNGGGGSPKTQGAQKPSGAQADGSGPGAAEGAESDGRPAAEGSNSSPTGSSGQSRKKRGRR